MIIDRRTLLGTALAASSTAILPRRSRAQSNTIKIGVLNDQSGPYRDIAGMHSVNAAKLAVKEIGARHERGGHLRRPPEQARHRRRHRAPVDRPATAST